MEINRINPADRWSDAVIHNGTLYCTCVANDLTADAGIQTASALAELDAVLRQAGSDKTRLLDVTIFLVDLRDFGAMNAVWDQWVTHGHAPVRCTVQAQLMDPRFKIEIKAIAAV
ncbi:RidA family protein [Affinibrenneria salicis]|uniref:RidA family protein n=1 Tax=Affinibrenneria salicis TaxID=2590031 RepID=A0A5J5G4G8_9GAMM|nr:RidA family protein [Affinibrenneria salicis]KAA9001763.1 RidA family protein [Affinibrenneria salicis]